jgi:hypothetical protein
MKRPYIVYSLSKDRTTQKFNKSKFQDIIEDLSVFLQNCTTTNINEADDVELTAYSAYVDDDPAEALSKIIKKATEHFGQSDSAPVAFHYPSGEPHSASKFKWKFPKSRLLEAIQYVIDNSPMPKSSLGPLELFISYDSKLTEPRIKKELPNQEHVSILCIWLSRSKSCSPTLFFPFEQPDKEFWSYIDNTVPFLPFKLEEKYLRLAQLNKQGEVKSFKKVQRPLSREQPLTEHLQKHG